MKHVEDYLKFHGMDKAVKRTIAYEAPVEPLIRIGELVELVYKPDFKSKVKGINYTHRMGDTGTKVHMSNSILACDANGNLFLLKKNVRSKRPYFNERGIIG